ncbi:MULTISPECIES: ABC transporter ATPase [Robiginitalea]|uniref:ABC transporter ATPase n=1 Tax=Robiginitalea TaxID=252306 RepID=UPI00234A9514|nr:MULTISPECIES: ABC transporter ATPase [unclassified Robiginitalea]MDC6353800.1 ABC transporter ATPase [Robiginitalea sp. PM2]MDC6374067.1 ABC transporter ATPase [Robiginitalea sp. SP8]
MLVPFEELPEEARVWVYQANRPLTDEEAVTFRAELETFLKEWTAHGADLRAGCQLPYNRFVVIGLDQDVNAASGCSIDASVRFIQSLEEKYEIALLDRMNVTYRQGEYLAYKPLADFRKMAKDKAVSGKTVVFNNLVTNKREFENDWEVPASESWHSRFF